MVLFFFDFESLQLLLLLNFFEFLPNVLLLNSVLDLRLWDEVLNEVVVLLLWRFQARAEHKGLRPDWTDVGPKLLLLPSWRNEDGDNISGLILHCLSLACDLLQRRYLLLAIIARGTHRRQESLTLKHGRLDALIVVVCPLALEVYLCNVLHVVPID